MRALQLPTDRLDEFCRRHGLELMVLFGSQAKGHATPRSDIDLAVLSSRDDSDTDYREEVWEDLLRLLGRGDVDLVWLRYATPLLAYQVATTGEVICEARPGVWRDFVIYALKRHWDARKFYDLRREAARRFLRIHGHA